MLKRADEIGLTSRGRLRKKKKPELTESQQRELKDAFELFDSEKTGLIDTHELKIAMRALGFNVKKKEVVEMVNRISRDDSGRIDLSDFLHIMRDKYAARDPNEEIEKAFRLFDEDGTGKISIRVRERPKPSYP